MLILKKNSYIQIIKPNQTNLKWEVLFAFDKLNVYMYIRNLKYQHLTSVFRLNNIHLEFTNWPHKFRSLLCTKKTVVKNFDVQTITRLVSKRRQIHI